MSHLLNPVSWWRHNRRAPKGILKDIRSPIRNGNKKYEEVGIYHHPPSSKAIVQKCMKCRFSITLQSGSVMSCQKYLNKGSINPTPTYILKIHYCKFRNYFDLFHVLCVCCYSISTFRNLRMMDRNTFVNDVSREIIENAFNVSYVRTQNFSSIDLKLYAFTYFFQSITG